MGVSPSECCLFCPQKQAYLIASAVISLIYVLCAAILFFGVKEQKGMNPWDNNRSNHLFDSSVEYLKQKYAALNIYDLSHESYWLDLTKSKKKKKEKK